MMRRARNLMYQQHESEADRNDKRAAEARLRRLAMSRGLVLRKQRRLDKNAYDYGRYRLYGPNGIQVGNEGIAVFGLSLDQVEEYRITGKMPVFPTKPLGQLCDQDPTAPGGWDPHHPSSHIDGPLQPVAGKALLVRTSTAERRAVLLLDSMIGSYRALATESRSLPKLSAYSWRIDVLVKPVGWLGTYRKSSESGLWLTGRHSVHIRGI
jgi:hypothetical protein